MHKRGLCCRAVSVCLSVMLVDCIHMAEDIVKLLPRPSSPIILVFWLQRRCPTPRETPSVGGAKYTGVGKFCNFRLKSLFISEMVRDMPLVAMTWISSSRHFWSWISKTRNSAIAEKLGDAFRGQSRSTNMVPFYVMYGLLLVCYINFVRKRHCFCDIILQKWCNVENRVRSPWRSLKMSPFDREPMNSYLCSVVTIALSRVVSKTLNVKEYHHLEIIVKFPSRSLKWYHSIYWIWFPISIL